MRTSLAGGSRAPYIDPVIVAVVVSILPGVIRRARKGAEPRRRLLRLEKRLGSGLSITLTASTA
jgi:hypothetical protein